ncbi:MAG: CRISPR-associated protein Cas4 [Oscillospiraceae bacterium]|nr:CRISPR-associated protein Cas4 [Oscillospiraceae bacterium]
MYENGVIRSEDFLMLSGLQHFAFCPRQWALIHLEGQWAENVKTVEGNLLHEKCHSAEQSERRGDALILRDLRIFSNTLGLSGACDVVEFSRDENGVTLHGREGRWHPFPIEYKRGKPKEHRADELQLCAQAMCLEEMLCCTISEGALFYGESRRRQGVQFDTELREQVVAMTQEMHQYARRGHTPHVRPRKGCPSCSLKELCLPKLLKKRSASDWVKQRVEEVQMP